jgi:Protein of unknown function (DUF3987)
MLDNGKVVSRAEPCVVCGKPDWCYSIGVGTAARLVCRRLDRDGLPLPEFLERTDKNDAEGCVFLKARTEEKKPRPFKNKEFVYKKDGLPILKVVAEYVNGKKKGVLPYLWDSDLNAWNKHPGLGNRKETSIPFYNHDNVLKAKKIFFVEGESCAEAINNLGLTATTIRGKTLSAEHIAALRDKTVILCPDRDAPGVKFMLSVKSALEAAEVKQLLAPPHSFHWQHLPASDGLDVADWVASGAKREDIIAAIAKETLHQYLPQNIQPERGGAPVSVVSDAQLDGDSNTEITPITDAEKAEYADLQKRKLTEFDARNFLPLPLAEAMIADGKLQNTDPVSYMAYLLPIICSLMDIVSLPLGGDGFEVPNIIWAVIIQESGGGKSRAAATMSKQLDNWQQEANERFQKKSQEYRQALKKYNASKSDEMEPVAPKLRKYLFNVATPQAVVRRIADQEEGNGIVWIRDELKGLFSGLNQFTNEGEGLEILLESWNGKGCTVDRVDATVDSYFIPDSRLSLVGGIQPSMVPKVFDPQDPQGTMGRMLPVFPQKIKNPELHKGTMRLKLELPKLYSFVKSQSWENVRLSEDSQAYYEEIYKEIGATKTNSDFVQVWLNKASGHVGRVAFALHPIECFYFGGTKDPNIVSSDTIKRAYEYIQLVMYWMHLLTGVLSPEDNPRMPAIMEKILEKAAASSEPLSLKDFYRSIKALRTLARNESVPISQFTLGICTQLAEMGKGTILKGQKGGALFQIARDAATTTAPSIPDGEDQDEWL